MLRHTFLQRFPIHSDNSVSSYSISLRSTPFDIPPVYSYSISPLARSLLSLTSETPTTLALGSSSRQIFILCDCVNSKGSALHSRAVPPKLTVPSDLDANLKSVSKKGPYKGLRFTDVLAYKPLKTVLEHEAEPLLPIYPKSSLEMLEAVFIPEVWQTLCESTKRSTSRPWQDPAVPELRIWIGLLLYMGVVVCPSVEDYWQGVTREHYMDTMNLK